MSLVVGLEKERIRRLEMLVRLLSSDEEEKRA